MTIVFIVIRAVYYHRIHNILLLLYIWVLRRIIICHWSLIGARRTDAVSTQYYYYYYCVALIVYIYKYIYVYSIQYYVL